MTKWTIPADMLAAQAEADALRARVAELEAALKAAAEALEYTSDCSTQRRPQYAAITAKNSAEDARAALAASREDKACGGCGETDPSKRCIGCFHDFTSREDKG